MDIGTLLTSSASPKSFLTYLGAIVISFVLAYAVDILYRMYSAKSSLGIGVNKSFILIAPAVTSIFLVIQFSLPLSLGLLGALSFVRFRTPIKEPEEIGFILITIALSLSCAVFRFDVAAILLVLLTVISFLKGYGAYSDTLLKRDRPCELFVTTVAADDKDRSNLQSVMDELKKSKLSAELISISNSEKTLSYHFRIHRKRLVKIDFSDTISQIRKLCCVSNVNLIVSPT